jgi:hypothetical protein
MIEKLGEGQPSEQRTMTMRILLGPILLLLDVAPENQEAGVALCLLLIPCLAAVIVRPRWWSALLSLFASVTWMFIGLVADGINC